MSEDEMLERLSEKMATKWEELEEKIDNFVGTLSSETPPMIMIIALMAKASDIAFEEGWDEETFMKMASVTHNKSRGAFVDSESIH